MLQRIQTLYLLLACGLTASLFFIPMCEHAGGVTVYSDYTGLLILLLLSAAVPFGTIFLYRQRTRQIRLCIVSGIILIGFQGLIAYYFFTLAAAFSITAVFPLAAAILILAASRKIARDEAMVRAANRIR
jgi:hypothetical protein